MKTEDKKNLASQLEDQLSDKLESICNFIFTHPELGGHETKSSQHLVDLMAKEGFQIQYPYGSEKTAFRAEMAGSDGPVIALLAEYDALPGYGPQGEAAHACGHNWIAAVTAGVAITIGRMIEYINGKIVLIGTPAEETYNGKVIMLKEGCFDDIDIILQAHIEERTDIMAPALAMDSLEFTFKGKPAHAAQYPYEGINALDAVQLTFAGVNALRQQVMQDIRIHGIITEGGQAINIIPERAACSFYVRGKKRSYVDKITKRVINCAKGAALMTGAEMQVHMPEASLDDIVTIPVLVDLAERNMMKNGFSQVKRTWDPMPGSTDIGNVSNRVPTLYAEIGLQSDAPFQVHDKTALDYVNSAYAYERLHQMVKSFAGMAIDIFDQPELAAKARAELESQRKNAVGGKNE